MKKIKNVSIKLLTGENATMEWKGKTKPLALKDVAIAHFGIDPTTGEESIKVFDLGKKIVNFENDVVDFVLEDAEFNLLRKICDPGERKALYASLVYAQIEQAFNEAEDINVKEEK